MVKSLLRPEYGKPKEQNTPLLSIFSVSGLDKYDESEINPPKLCSLKIDQDKLELVLDNALEGEYINRLEKS